MKTQRIPLGCFRAAVGPKTLNEDNRTAEIQWGVGQRGLRNGWEGRYYEELSMSPSHVRLGRAKGGLPFVDGHQAWDNDRSLGIVEDVRIKKGEDGNRFGFGVVRFDTHPLAEQRYQSVKNNILRDVSVGYRVYKYERGEDQVESDGSKTPVYRAVDWEPIEISLVTAGFDTTAKIRSEGEDIENECEIFDDNAVIDSVENDPLRERTIEKGASMPVDTAPIQEPVVTDAAAVAREAIEIERKRVSEITADCFRSGHPELAAGFVSEGVASDAVRAVLLEKLASRNANVASSRPAEIVRDESETRFSAMVEAVAHRANARLHKLSDNGRRFMSHSLADLARELTGKTGSAMAVVTDALTNRAYMSTSSFPNLLEDIQTKTLRAEIEAQVGSFEPFVRRSTLPDFKTASRARLGDMQDLIEMPEGAEFTIGESSDSREPIRLRTFGRKVGLSRQAIINDDLDAFSRFPTQFVTKLRNLEANLVYSILVNNANMSDGIALFNRPGHGNRSNANTVINVANLGLAIADFRTQVSETGMPLNIFPRFLVVPPALESVARQFVTALTPAASANVNPYQGVFDVIVDARLQLLAGGSVTRWFLIADPSQIDTIELASLAGGESVNLDRMDDPNSLGVWWNAYADRGAAPIDWRGMFDNLGA